MNTQLTLASINVPVKDKFSFATCPSKSEPAKSDIKHTKLGTPSDVWGYRNQNGQLMSLICRFETEDMKGNRSKEYRPYSYVSVNGGHRHWRWKGLSNPWPLYNLDQITINPAKPILVCEGEKAAEAAATLYPDHVCISPMFGAKSPHKTDWGPISDRGIIIAGDNDSAGEQFVKKVARIAIENGAASVQLLKLNFLGKHIPSGGEITQRGAPCPEKFDLADALEEGWTPKLIKEFEIKNGSELYKDFVLPEWPFRQKGKGIEVQIPVNTNGSNGDKEKIWARAFSMIKVLGRAATHGSDKWSTVVEITDPSGVRHTELVAAADLNGRGFTDLKARLASFGLVYAQRNNSADYLWRFITHSPTKKTISLVLQSGWQKDGSFVTPNWQATGDVEELIYFDDQATKPQQFTQSGSLKEWQNHIASPIEDNPLLVFAASAALAPVLLRSMGMDGFGFHFFGSSSTGKTTCLRVAASLWGNHQEYLKTWNLTSTALEGTATLHNDILLCLDEIGQADPLDVYTAGYELANGQGKGRGTVYGGVQERSNWKLLFLSNGEISFDDYAKSKSQRGAMAGQKARIISIPAEADKGMGIFSQLPEGYESPGDFANALRDNAGIYFGAAAKEFVKVIHEEIGVVTLKARQIINRFVEETCQGNVDGQVRRVATNFGLVAATGEVAIEMAILPWRLDTAYQAAAMAFKLWLTNRGGTQSDEIIQGVRAVRTFIQEHGENRFTVMQKKSGTWRAEQNEHYSEIHQSRTNDRVGYRYLDENDEWVHLIFPEAWSDKLCTGKDAKLIARELANLGHLRTSHDNRCSVSRTLPGLGKLRVYEIKSSILSGEISV